MDRLVVAVAIVAVAAAAAALLRRRRRTDPPTQPVGRVPVQLDRADFSRPEAPWLVAVFTSASCQTCHDVATKAAVLESDDVAVAEIEFGRDRAVHERYHIDSVPLVVLADARGVVHRSFLGPITATDLWAAVAWTREGDDTTQC
jgi:hypothetical protein